MRRKYWSKGNITVRIVPYERQHPFRSITLGLVLDLMRFEELRDRAHDAAHAASQAYGCASCRGIETAKSCIIAYNDEIGDARSVFSAAVIADMNALAARLHPIVADPFGATAEARYRDGLRDALGQPFNILNTRAYGELKTNKAYIVGRGFGNAVKKQSAHAHAVVSRHSLEVGIRFGICEYLAAMAFAGSSLRFRHVKHIARRSLVLVDPDAQIESILRAELDYLGTACAKWERDGSWMIDWDFGLTLLGRLVSKFAEITRSTERYRRASCVALAAVYRAILLHYARKNVRRTKTWPGIEAYAAVLGEIFAYRPISNIGGSDSPETRVENFSEVITRKGGTLLNLVESHGRKWTVERLVELGKQCGECEVQQGSFDLVGRALEAYVTNGGRSVNPMAGAVFCDLGVDATDGDTVWDLQNAITLTAVKIVLADLHTTANAGTDARCRLAADVMATLDESGPLFLVYMEVLFLGMGYEGGSRMAKVFEERGVDRSDLDGTIALVGTDAGLDRASGTNGPTVLELSEAARRLGLSFSALRDEETPLDKLNKQYRELARAQHPDRASGSTSDFQRTANAVALLRTYFAGEVGAARGVPLALTEH